MRTASRKSLEDFLDRINNVARTKTRMVNVPLENAIAVSTAITELLAELNEENDKRAKPVNIVNTNLDGGNF
jgi:hypothetical protein|tara:strand:- start:227 stop:442 length:216 start_codon:yes stop_codon:yes gene_type:complete